MPFVGAKNIYIYIYIRGIKDATPAIDPFLFFPCFWAWKIIIIILILPFEALRQMTWEFFAASPNNPFHTTPIVSSLLITCPPHFRTRSNVCSTCMMNLYLHKVRDAMNTTIQCHPVWNYQSINFEKEIFQFYLFVPVGSIKHNQEQQCLQSRSSYHSPPKSLQQYNFLLVSTNICLSTSRIASTQVANYRSTTQVATCALGTLWEWVVSLIHISICSQVKQSYFNVPLLPCLL